jgi:hypothetical protein
VLDLDHLERRADVSNDGGHCIEVVLSAVLSALAILRSLTAIRK